jgi:hypothetical protein
MEPESPRFRNRVEGAAPLKSREALEIDGERHRVGGSGYRGQPNSPGQRAPYLLCWCPPDRTGGGASRGPPLGALDRGAGRRGHAQAGWGVASPLSTSTTSAGAFWRLERASAGTATAEIPAPNRYDAG